MAAVEFESTGVGAVSEQFAPPKPTKSSTPSAAPGQVPVSVTWLPTSATLPAVPDIAMEPLASGVGRAGAAALLPAPCCTR